MLPQIRRSSVAAVTTAQAAEQYGFHGLFAFDHLWAPGRRDAPTQPQFPLLREVALATGRIVLGTLIARVDTRPLAELVDDFERLRAVAGNRIIAGLGTGDRLTREEDAFRQVPERSYEDRLALLDEACEVLVAREFPVWLAGSSDGVTTLAAAHGACVHLWEPSQDKLAGKQGFTWGGVLEGPPDRAAGRLATISNAGASWAVCGYRGGVEVGAGLPELVSVRKLLAES